MRGKVAMDSTPEGHFPNQAMDFDLIGAVPKPGSIEYGFDGMIGYHNNVVDYFRASADIGKITVAFNVALPQAATALHRLITLVGHKVRKVLVSAYRDDGTIYAYLELDSVKIGAVSPVSVSSGTVYLVTFQTARENVGVSFGRTRYGAQGRL